jgi:hypothetical protein
MTKPSQSRAPKISAGSGSSGSALKGDPGSGYGAFDRDAGASFAQLRGRLAGDARIAVAVQPLGGGPLQTFGGDPLMPAMSTSKVFILTALLADRGGAGHLTSEQKSLAQTAITESDNDSILALFSGLEVDQGGLTGASNYATNLLHKAGDTATTVSTGPIPAGYATTFGQTPWTPAQEVTFFRALANGCVLPSADADYELGLMRQVVASESWGLGSAGFTHVAFKGGWGPLPGGYGVRQTGIIGTGRKAIVVSIAADPATSFTTGQSVLDQIARWVRSEIRPGAYSTAACAG